MDMFIDGTWVGSEETIDVIDPADGTTIDNVPNGSSEDVDKAVQAAKEAFKSYSRLSQEERNTLLKKAGALLKERSGDMAELLSREQGKPQDQARQEIFYTGMVLDQFVGLEPKEELLKETETAKITSVPKPMGVCALILPWNFPAAVMAWKLAPALLTGNTVVVKPSPHTPLTNLKIAEVLTEVFPRGVINVVTGDDDTGKDLVEHPDISKVAFTGSVETGPKIAASAGSRPTTLELGGNDPAIVLPDHDPANTKTLWNYVFRNAGQICTAIKRIYVHEDIYDQFTKDFTDLTNEMKVGRGTEEGVSMGPINNKEQFDIVKILIGDAVSRGADVLTGGEPLTGEGFDGGFFFPPTVLGNCKDDWPVVNEEQFGPVIPILKYTDIDDAMERANSTRYGLGGSIWTKDIEKGRELALRLESGIVWVNQHGAFDTTAPFGGIKDSGHGKELGHAGAEEYVGRQTVYVAK